MKPFTVVDGRLSPDAIADEASMEAAVLREEMLATARRLRLVLLLPIWSTDEFRPVARPLRAEVDRLERRAEGSGRVA